MTIVTNYASLSPAMRDALTAELQPWGESDENKPAVLVLKSQATLDALAKRGLVEQRGERWQRYAEPTEAGHRARAALAVPPEQQEPAKVAVILDRARELDLVVWMDPNRLETMRHWAISSPNPHDRSKVWLYWHRGRNGGTLHITVYYGPNHQQRNATRTRAFIRLNNMAESLQRHLEREAIKHEEEATRLADTAPDALHEMLAAAERLNDQGRAAVLRLALTKRAELEQRRRAASCATCWPRPCGPEPYRSLCRRESQSPPWCTCPCHAMPNVTHPNRVCGCGKASRMDAARSALGRFAAEFNQNAEAIGKALADAGRDLNGRLMAASSASKATGVRNLLHETLSTSTVHANDDRDRPACGAPILGGEMTGVAHPVDCPDCLIAINGTQESGS